MGPPPAPQVVKVNGIYRPSIVQLQETILALDELYEKDAVIRAKVADMQRLLDTVHQKELVVCRKIKDLQKTRLAVEALYVANVKANPALIGQNDVERDEARGGLRCVLIPVSKRLCTHFWLLAVNETMKGRGEPNLK